MEEQTQNDVNVRLMYGFISIREKKLEAATLWRIIQAQSNKYRAASRPNAARNRKKKQEIVVVVVVVVVVVDVVLVCCPPVVPALSPCCPRLVSCCFPVVAPVLPPLLSPRCPPPALFVAGCSLTSSLCCSPVVPLLSSSCPSRPLLVSVSSPLVPCLAPMPCSSQAEKSTRTRKWWLQRTRAPEGGGSQRMRTRRHN